MYYNPLFLQTPSILEDAFYQSDLGRLHRSIPFKELASKIPSPCEREVTPTLAGNIVHLNRRPFLLNKNILVKYQAIKFLIESGIRIRIFYRIPNHLI